MMLVRTRVAPSAIHGLGLFAAQPTACGTPIWRFEPGFDRDFPAQEVAALPPLAQEHTRWFSWVSRENGHAILSGDHACFMNHSPTPNTGRPSDAAPTDTTVALRDIAAGEELTCDYCAFDADAPRKLGRASGG
jgi:SET domain-containing protein